MNPVEPFFYLFISLFISPWQCFARFYAWMDDGARIVLLVLQGGLKVYKAPQGLARGKEQDWERPIKMAGREGWGYPSHSCNKGTIDLFQLQWEPQNMRYSGLPWLTLPTSEGSRSPLLDSSTPPRCLCFCTQRLSEVLLWLYFLFFSGLVKAMVTLQWIESARVLRSFYGSRNHVNIHFISDLGAQTFTDVIRWETGSVQFQRPVCCQSMD